MNMGHGREEVISAAFEQARRLVHIASYYYYAPPVIQLARKLAEIMPSKRLTKSFFGNSGAEANECALKLARRYTKKHKVIALIPSFHGRTLSTMSITGLGRRASDPSCQVLYLLRPPIATDPPSAGMRRSVARSMPRSLGALLERHQQARYQQ